MSRCFWYNSCWSYKSFLWGEKKCDYLFVTVTEDKYVNKGPNRPVNNHYFRAQVLASLKQVDYVGINYAPDATTCIDLIKPDFYFKGKDYKGKRDLTSRLNKEISCIKKNKGKIIYTISPLKSSTEIINKSFSYIFDSKLKEFLSKKNKIELLNYSLQALEKIKDNKTFTKPSAKRRQQLSAARFIQHVRDLHRD